MRYWRILNKVRISLLILVYSFLWVPFVAAFNLSKEPSHYLGEIETYYLRPRPEMLEPMLVCLDRAGMLDNAPRQMFIASFLGALFREKQVEPEVFLENQRNLSASAWITLAWALHLANRDDLLTLQPFSGQSARLREHIGNTPADLLKWSPDWEKSVVDMYWAAFMATGKQTLLNAIVNAALAFAHNRNSETGRYAAATLYDYAPRHPLVRKVVKEKLATARPSEKGMLETILGNCE